MIRYQILLLFFLISTTTFARKVIPSDLSYYYEQNDSVIRIEQDGSYTSSNIEKIKITKEEGINFFKIFKINYVKDYESIDIKSVRVINRNKSSVVKLEDISDKSLSVVQQGIENYHAKIIPLKNLKVGSIIEIKYDRKAEANLHKSFNIDLEYGVSVYEKKSTVEFYSPFKLNIKSIDKMGHLDIIQSKKDNLFYTKVFLKKPVLNMPFDERSALYDNDERVYVGVSSQKDWKSFRDYFYKEYEALLSKELPKKYSSILEEAKKEEEFAGKVDIVLANLAKKINYIGDWRNSRKRVIPSSLEKIAENGYGDCKSYSLVATKLFRLLGYKANVAFVYRSLPNQLSPLLSEVPRTSLFNHAILKLVNGENEYWIDPTNPSSYLLKHRSDIAGKDAIVLTNNETIALEQIPEINSVDNKYNLTKNYIFKDDFNMKVEGEFSLEGSEALMLQQLSNKLGSERFNKIMSMLVKGIDEVDNISLPGIKVDKYRYTPIQSKFSYNGKFTDEEERGISFYSKTPAFLKAFLATSETDVFDRYLGEKSYFKDSFVLENIKLVDSNVKSCNVNSEWLDLKVDFKNIGNNIHLVRTFNLKKNRLSAKFYETEKLKKVQADIRECGFFRPFKFSNMNSSLTKDRILEILAKDINYRYNYAEELYFSDKSLDKIIKVLNSILREQPDHYKSLILYSRIELDFSQTTTGIDKFRFNKAMKLVEKAKLSNPSNLDWLEMETRLLIKAKKKEEALKLLSKVEGDVSGDDLTKLYMIKGMAYRELSDNKNSITWYKKALEGSLSQRDESALHLGIGKSYYYDEDYKNAEVHLKSCTKIDPSNQFCFLNLSYMYKSMERYDDAILYGEKAYDIKKNGYSKYNLTRQYNAKAFFLHKKLKRANPRIEKLFKKSLEVLNVDANRMAYAQYLSLTRQFKKSKAILKDVLKYSTDNYYRNEASFLLLDNYAKLKNYKLVSSHAMVTFEMQRDLNGKLRVLNDLIDFYQAERKGTNFKAMRTIIEDVLLDQGFKDNARAASIIGRSYYVMYMPTPLKVSLLDKAIQYGSLAHKLAPDKKSYKNNVKIYTDYKSYVKGYQSNPMLYNIPRYLEGLFGHSTNRSLMIVVIMLSSGLVLNRFRTKKKVKSKKRKRRRKKKKVKVSKKPKKELDFDDVA